MKKDRRSFLTQVCPTVAFAFFGLSFLEACSTDSSSEPEGPDPGQGNTGDDGYSINGNTVTIDLSNSNFSVIGTSGGFKNLLDAGVLLSSNKLFIFIAGLNLLILYCKFIVCFSLLISSIRLKYIIRLICI